MCVLPFHINILVIPNMSLYYHEDVLNWENAIITIDIIYITYKSLGIVTK